MPETSVQIYDKAFKARGVEATFDTEQNAAFVNEFAPGASAPAVVIAPHMLWQRGSIVGTLRGLARGETFFPIGGYRESTNTVTIPARKDPDKVNKLYRHEMKHFFDAANGESDDSPRITRKRLVGGFAVAGAGMAIGLLTGNRKLTAASAGLALAIPALAYAHAPHEIEARHFAKSKEVTDNYGKIISYKIT